MLKVRVITLDTKENPIEDKTFPEFHSNDFDVYITECYQKLENGEIYGIKIIRVVSWADDHLIQHGATKLHSSPEICVPA